MKQPPKTQVPASACADTCIGLRRYLHEATQVSALKPHSFKGQRDRYVGSQSFLSLLSLPSGFSGPALPTSTLQNYIQSSKPPNMVCRCPTLVCRCRILYLQHPTSVKNRLHFRTFSAKALHNPNKCFTFAAPEPAKPLNDAQMCGSFFICTYGKQDNIQ